jgi:hypothetical protein
VREWVISFLSWDSSQLEGLAQERCQTLFDLLGFGLGSGEPEQVVVRYAEHRIMPTMVVMVLVHRGQSGRVLGIIRGCDSVISPYEWVTGPSRREEPVVVDLLAERRAQDLVVQAAEAAGDVTLDEQGGSGPGVSHLPQRGVAALPRAEPVGPVGKVGSWYASNNRRSTRAPLRS